MFGIFDSGLGGLMTLKAIQKSMPGENIIYFGDLANLPYGTKSKEKIVELTIKNINFLVQKGARKIIIACNSASANAIPELVKKFPRIHFFNVIDPAVDAAIKVTQNNRIGVIGTTATISSKIYNQKFANNNSQLEIISVACPLLVPLIEEGEIDAKITNLILQKYLKSLKKAKIDTLILGCTHYPLLKNQIQKIIGSKIKIIDSSIEIVKKLKENFQPMRKRSNRNIEFYVTDMTPGFDKIFQSFNGHLIIKPRIVKI
jgi:glutamate racemase